MSGNRGKGLARVREVKQILEVSGHIVEGPGYKTMFINGKLIPVHRDFFGVFDLLEYSKDSGIYGHQVCDYKQKLRNARKIYDAGLTGDLWCHEPRQGYSRYYVYQLDGEMKIEQLASGIQAKISRPKVKRISRDDMGIGRVER